MDVDHTITLLKPITWGGQRITEIGFREPTGGDVERMQAAKGTDTEKSFRLMADLSQTEPDMIRALALRDINQINDWLEPIMDPKREGQAKA